MSEWLSQIATNIDSFFAALGDLSKQQKDIIGISVIVMGVLFGFLGFKFFKYLLGLAGFLAGGLIGLTVFYYIPWVNTTGEIGQLVVGALCGAVGALVFYFLFYYFGIFVFGAVAAMWLGMIFLPRFGRFSDYRLLLVLALGFAGGLLAFLIRRIIIIISTAAIGAILITLGVGHFYQWPVSATTFSISNTFNGQFIDTVVNHNDGVIIIAVTAALFLGGLVVQYYTDKRKVNGNG
jgi:hypothetical protein